MSYFLIRGGNPLKGSVAISGSSDAAVSMIAAALLTDEKVCLLNVSAVEDVQLTLDVVRGLGVKVEDSGGELCLQADDIGAFEISQELGGQKRTAAVCLGPLLARFGKTAFPVSEECLIGDYPIDRHLRAFEALGAEISYEDGKIGVKAERLGGAPIRFSRNTVLGTENAILASVLASGETTILGAAQEPEVDDLVELLLKMGAKIKRDEEDPRRIIIEGVERLTGAKHEVLSDRNEAVTFAVATAATRGDVTLENVRPQNLTAFLSKFQAVGAGYEVLGDKIRVWADSDVGFQPVTVETAPHPGFMSDWQAPFSILLARAVGESLIHETVYLRRLGYFEELAKMGVAAKIITPGEAGLVFDSEKYGFDWPPTSQGQSPKEKSRVFQSQTLHKVKSLTLSPTLGNSGF